MAWDPRPIAGMWVRFFCYIGDQLLAIFLGGLLGWIITLPLAASVTTKAEDDAVSGIIFGIIVITNLTYFTVFYATLGRTPVMMAGRLYVIQAYNGQTLTWPRAFVRALVLGIGNICGLLALVWLIITSSSSSRQGPHDSAARSLVVRAAG